MLVKISDQDLASAAKSGIDEFLELVISRTKQAIGGELDGKSFSLLNSSQITLLGYDILHEELMDGGFVQLIYNGYGPFVFDNPFARALRDWGLRDLYRLLEKAKKYYIRDKKAICRELSDEEFMALFEQMPEFDELDDEFVENEEDFTAEVARYVDNNLDKFVEVVE